MFNIKGIFNSPILYTLIVPSGDSSPYFGTYEGQKFGFYDTDCCWDFSSTEVAETRLTTLRDLGMISSNDMLWLTQNGYVDSDGDFYLSRRWVAILAGTTDNGNYQQNFWDLAKTVGFIPNSLLPYNQVEAYQWLNKTQFNNDYFNQSVITPQMRALGAEFAKRFSIQAVTTNGGYLGDLIPSLPRMLKGGSIVIGIPVPQNGTWNQVNVNQPPGNTTPQHAVEMYKFDPTQPYPFFIYDSYEPHLKNLSQNYYIPLITQVSILPVAPVSIPVTPQPAVSASYWTQFWANIVAWLKGQALPFPSVPIGNSPS